ncbi:alpha/beta hydrolase [Deinococcus sonorensis]|uniref:Alpha/beta hydrolase n=2 Tax=Deinococcus sonorensis TaxID=309891 RepID=A0AAU7U6B6_9DEIO
MTSTESRTLRLDLPDLGPVPLQFDARGEGRPFLLLHGGAGPASVARFAEQLATARAARVYTPTHPGFQGIERPAELTTPRQLAAVYEALLVALDLTDVTVVGNSIGGWIAAELALRHPARVSSIVLVNAVGVDLPEHPVADFFTLTFDQIAEYSYAEPDRYRLNPAQLSPEAQRVMALNRAALAVYGGEPSMVDPGLPARLPGITLPTLVVWGEADRITDPQNGRAYADAIPGAQFVLMEGTGHLPQIESPERLLELLWAFAADHPAARP